MGQISYRDYKAPTVEKKGGFKVGFLSLKNDGDEAIVRIMHDNVDSFDMVTTHQATIDGRMRRVGCLRSPSDPLSECPFCEAGKPVQTRLYVHLIQYVRNDQGQIVPLAKVWERPASFARTLAGLIEEYGPLSNSVFKIKRSGAAGSTATTYSVLYGNPVLYPAETYPKKDDAFAGYCATGHAVLNKSAAELSTLLGGKGTPEAIEEFPKKEVVPEEPSWATSTAATGAAPWEGPTEPFRVF